MSGKQRKVDTKDLSKPYEPTPHERAVAKAYFASEREVAALAAHEGFNEGRRGKQSHRIIQTPELGTYFS